MNNNNNNNPLSQLSLPPGFRFYPTDEELLVKYLCRKVAGQQFSLQIIGEIDLYNYDPWELPSMAMFGEKEWYFFSSRDRKYPNGSRPNRVAGSGYWKATGTDKVITTEGRKVGIKKALVFYIGKAPKGTKTNWIMHEYRLFQSSNKPGSLKLDDWVLCRIYKKNAGGQLPMSSVPITTATEHSHGGSSSSSTTQYDDVLDSLPEINDGFFPLPSDDKLNVQNLTSGNFNWASLAAVSSSPELLPVGQTQTQTQIPMAMNNYNNNNIVIDNQNDVYMPSMPPVCHVESMAGKSVDEVVQSHLRRKGLLSQNQSAWTNQSLGIGGDPFRIRYPTQTPSNGYDQFGFRQ